MRLQHLLLAVAVVGTAFLCRPAKRHNTIHGITNLNVRQRTPHTVTVYDSLNNHTFLIKDADTVSLLQDNDWLWYVPFVRSMVRLPKVGMHPIYQYQYEKGTIYGGHKAIFRC